MSHPVRDKYIEPMAAKDEKTKRSRKRDSGYGGTSSRRSNESTNGSSSRVGHIEPEMNITNHRFDSALQDALVATSESKERLENLNYNLEKEIAASTKENKRLRRERDGERAQNDELRAYSNLVNRDNEQLRKELAKLQKDLGKESRKSSIKSGSWKDLPVPLYRSKTPPPMVPEMTRGVPKPTSTHRRMSSSHAPPGYTYTVTPGSSNQR